jgi:hypothetical protein
MLQTQNELLKLEKPVSKNDRSFAKSFRRVFEVSNIQGKLLELLVYNDPTTW